MAGLIAGSLLSNPRSNAALDCRTSSLMSGQRSTEARFTITTLRMPDVSR